MAVSKLADIDKALGKVQRRTKADIAQKLAAGLPIATFSDGKMEIHQIISEPAPEFVTQGVKSRVSGAKLQQLSASQLKEFRARKAQEEDDVRVSAG